MKRTKRSFGKELQPTINPIKKDIHKKRRRRN